MFFKNIFKMYIFTSCTYLAIIGFNQNFSRLPNGRKESKDRKIEIRRAMGILLF